MHPHPKLSLGLVSYRPCSKVDVACKEKWCVNCMYQHILQTLENGTNVIQLENAAGAAIKNFNGAMGKSL